MGCQLGYINGNRVRDCNRYVSNLEHKRETKLRHFSFDQ